MASNPATSFGALVPLGRTGLKVSRVGLATGGGGLPAKEVVRAFDAGVNYVYWGTLRAKKFGEGIREIAQTRREAMVLVVQSYTRAAWMMKGSLERSLRQLGTDYADVLLLGWWNQPPPRRILDAALDLKERGRARHLMISCHDRSTFARYIADPTYEAIMVRYNAAHPGAETDVFPHLPERGGPGLVAYTVTRWGGLLDPSLVPEGERVPTSTDCYRFALSSAHVNLCLSAPQNAEQLDQTLATLRAGPMDAEELAWMKRVGAAVKAKAAKSGMPSPLAAIDRMMARHEGATE